ncbi:MAG: DsbA family protein [Gammaproteobacteria bacterium]|nr:DsbA family protein [Gammaproteobacteria bacterium]
MTVNIDLYYSIRSPYCYLSSLRIGELVAEYDLAFQVKPIYPLAINDPGFFKDMNPLFLPYFNKDLRRVAARLNAPLNWPPRPDPIVQDMETRAISPEQPYIRRLTHLAQVATEKGLGLAYVTAVSRMLYEVEGWDTGDHFANAISSAGLELDELEEIANADGERLEAALAANRADQLAAGHWGSPLFVVGDEAFFGQDRLDDLVWHLNNSGSLSRI